MYMHLLVGGALAASVTLAPAALAQRPPDTQATVAPLAPPPGAHIVAETNASEIRAFPETIERGGAQLPTERLVGVDAVDRAYQSNLSYEDTVAFFEEQFRAARDQVLQRTERPTSTSWLVRRADGRLASVVVRKTQPITFETLQVRGPEAIAHPKQP